MTERAEKRIDEDRGFHKEKCEWIPVDSAIYSLECLFCTNPFSSVFSAANGLFRDLICVILFNDPAENKEP